jgi:hypothetical protein
VSEQIIVVPSATAFRARQRLEQAEAIIAACVAAYQRVAALFTRVPAARGEQALSIRRAWFRASA